MGESYDIQAGPGSKCVTVLFSDSQRVKEIKNIFGENSPFNQEQSYGNNYECCKLVLQLISRSARDLLIMSVRSFEALITLEDGVIFNQVKKKLNDDLSVDKDMCIDMVTTNESLLREITFLYENNVYLTKENERYEGMVRNLEGELSRSVNCK